MEVYLVQNCTKQLGQKKNKWETGEWRPNRVKVRKERDGADLLTQYWRRCHRRQRPSHYFFLPEAQLTITRSSKMQLRLLGRSSRNLAQRVSLNCVQSDVAAEAAFVKPERLLRKGRSSLLVAKVDDSWLDGWLVGWQRATLLPEWRQFPSTFAARRETIIFRFMGRAVREEIPVMWAAADHSTPRL